MIAIRPLLVTLDFCRGMFIESRIPFLSIYHKLLVVMRLMLISLTNYHCWMQILHAVDWGGVTKIAAHMQTGELFLS